MSGPAEALPTTFGGSGRYTLPPYTNDDGSLLEPVSGTSYAAPYAAGGLALALQLHTARIGDVSSSASGSGSSGSSSDSGTGSEDADTATSIGSDHSTALRTAWRAAFNQRRINAALASTARPLGTNGLYVAEATAKQGAGECMRPVTTALHVHMCLMLKTTLCNCRLLMQGDNSTATVLWTKPRQAYMILLSC